MVGWPRNLGALCLSYCFGFNGRMSLSDREASFLPYSSRSDSLEGNREARRKRDLRGELGRGGDSRRVRHYGVSSWMHREIFFFHCYWRIVVNDSTVIRRFCCFIILSLLRHVNFCIVSLILKLNLWFFSLPTVDRFNSKTLFPREYQRTKEVGVSWATNNDTLTYNWVFFLQ